MLRECHGDRARNDEECHRDRARTDNECHGDRASNDKGCPGDRVFGMGNGQGGLGGNWNGTGGNGEQNGSGPKVELPVLPAQCNPMDLGDWLTVISPIMRDLSGNSSKWWDRTVQEAQLYYDQWKTSTPLQRVQIRASLPLELTLEPFVRTEQRGVGLLLRSIPEEMKQVVVSNRDVSSTAIIWRLLITFQPGGAGEKAQLLKLLTTLSMGGSAAEIATGLRQ